MQKITTYLWFDDQATEAARCYVSVFGDSRIVDVTRYGPAVPERTGTVMTVTFELAGQRFVALNGGPQFTFNEAMSLYVDCATQGEVDELWAKLTAGGGEPGRCGWLKDRFGVSWQVVPRRLMELLTDPDPARAARVQQAMFAMGKIEIEQLEEAYRNE